MNVHYTVALGNEEREVLRELCRSGNPRARKVKRALILLAADRGDTHEQIAQALNVGTSTVFRTKRDFVERGLLEALSERPRPGAKRCLNTKSCCWWRPHARSHRRGGRAGRSRFWRIGWCS